MLELLNQILSYIPVALLVMGIVFLVMEIYLPSFGITGVAGMILVLLGIGFLADSLIEGIIMLMIIVVFLTVVLVFSLKFIIKRNKSLILDESLSEDDTYDDLNFFLHKEGIVKTPLRPSGNVDFEGVKLSVVSEGDFIKAGSKVKVIKISGNQIVVSEIEERGELG